MANYFAIRGTLLRRVASQLAGLVSKNDALCITNDELCIKNEEFVF